LQKRVFFAAAGFSGKLPIFLLLADGQANILFTEILRQTERESALVFFQRGREAFSLQFFAFCFKGGKNGGETSLFCKKLFNVFVFKKKREKTITIQLKISVEIKKMGFVFECKGMSTSSSALFFFDFLTGVLIFLLMMLEIFKSDDDGCCC